VATSFRDKKVVGVFVRFHCAASVMLDAQGKQPSVQCGICGIQPARKSCPQQGYQVLDR
jgi:hypothetical protein